jgi:transcriptional regulator with XRE-family HTH domain
MGTMKAIQDYLRVAGITQAQLAKRAGISAANLNHFLNGRREPRIKNLRKLSEATGISIEKLVQGF